MDGSKKTNIGKTLVIAEAGVNHNGDVEVAKKLASISHSAGADVIKFQTFFAEELTTQYAKKATYQNSIDQQEDTQYEMLSRLELSWQDHTTILSHCNKLGIEFLSTGFSIHTLQQLVDMGIRRIKIPSGEITNLPYLRFAASCKLPLILSTGMSSMKEVAAAVNVLKKHSAALDLCILHCNTAYPTPIEDVNLNAMQSLAEAFQVPVGYSDHTLGHLVSHAAVAMGAVVIEKHITLDRRMSGPDHGASMEPDELITFIKGIREIESALGCSEKVISPSEAENREVARRSVVAASNIVKGQLFTEGNLTVKRPGNGLSPMCWDELLGQRAPRDFARDEQIEL